MDLYTVTVERVEQRRIRVAAHDPDEAMATVRDVLPPGARAIKAVPYGEVSATLGQEALASLLSRDFLPLDGETHVALETWLRRATAAAFAADEEALAALNRPLASAGFRVRLDGRICIGSPLSIPLLGRWCKGRAFGGGAFLPALAALPEATRCKGMTFAGIRSRAVTIPDHVVFATGGAN